MRPGPTKTLVFCLLAALGGIYALDWALAAGVHHLRTGKFGAFNRVNEGLANADIVVAGSSRAVFHYDPAAFSAATGWSTYNIGRIGAGTDITQGILLWYLNHNRKPRLVIVNADPGSLNASDDYYDPVQYTPYLRDDGLYGALRTRHPWIWRSRYLPLYGYVVNDVEWEHYKLLKSLWRRPPPEAYNNGYVFDHDMAWKTPLDAMYKKARRLDYSPDPGGVSDFNALLQVCQDRSIPVIVVFSPVFQPYWDLLKGRQKVISELAAASERHGAVFLDFSVFEPVAPDTYYFADPTHMNTNGATVFSTAVAARVKELLQSGRLGTVPDGK